MNTNTRKATGLLVLFKRLHDRLDRAAGANSFRSNRGKTICRKNAMPRYRTGWLRKGWQSRPQKSMSQKSRPPPYARLTQIEAANPLAMLAIKGGVPMARY